jgi:CRP/FNR family transcriptional regulator
MPDDKIAIFRKTELLRELDDSALADLASKAVSKKLRRNEILFLSGEPAKGMYVIASGAVRAFRMNPDGREQVIHVERAVTTIAEVPIFDNGTYPSTTAAEEPTLVYFLEKKLVLDTALRYPELALAAVRLIASRLRKCAELVETLSLREVGQRLARLLIEQAQLNGKQGSDGTLIELKLTHNQLASRIGTVREVVTRMLTRLQEQGLIVYEGKEILIPNLATLASYAEIEKQT